MKTIVSAILVAAVFGAAGPAVAASAAKSATQPVTQTAPAGLDERLGCGVMLVTIDEILQRNPDLATKFSKGDGSSAAMLPMLRMLGASGEILLDKAYAEGLAQGQTPTVLYRRGVANLSANFAAGGGKDQAMAVFTRCMAVAAPAS
ncbi:hypothetical protein PMI01_01275 [Caulobacter sp. AP07]|uniref:hypothetical protein n=1 Tax=Caulobacter sp. AP07 TaxID=1144304 RepID=UPI000271F74A|nr:hypothetical protein [Caulobacter sp. AP07]EJL35597.1 hypothetical protein PMI01_01275 [Caulobacter sp. AP07]